MLQGFLANAFLETEVHIKPKAVDSLRIEGKRGECFQMNTENLQSMQRTIRIQDAQFLLLHCALFLYIFSIRDEIFILQRT